MRLQPNTTTINKNTPVTVIPLIRKKNAPVSLATALAIKVFPVPGGPYRRIPRGGWGGKEITVTSQRHAKIKLVLNTWNWTVYTGSYMWLHQRLTRSKHSSSFLTSSFFFEGQNQEQSWAPLADSVSRASPKLPECQKKAKITEWTTKCDVSLTHTNIKETLCCTFTPMALNSAGCLSGSSTISLIWASCFLTPPMSS